MMWDKWMKTLLAIALLLCVWALAKTPAWAENRWGLGTDIGFLADTVDDEVFTLSFQGDYFLDEEISLGPQLLITPGGDLTQITFAGIARYYIPIGAVTISPFAGLGFVYADLDKGRTDDDDLSYSFPLGATAAFQVSRTISLASTLLFTFQDIDLKNQSDSDNMNLGLFFGFRYRP